MGGVLKRMMSLFYSKKLEVVLVGLEKSGKTTLLTVLADGVSPADTAPTIGLNVKMVKKGGVQMKCWDLGGQSQYRAEWGRYT
jgi:Arf/Sar family protein